MQSKIQKLANLLNQKGYTNLGNKLFSLSQTMMPLESQKKYQVTVSYPSFDQDGLPYFDNNSVSETLTMAEGDLVEYKKKEGLGQVKLISIREVLPKTRTR